MISRNAAARGGNEGERCGREDSNLHRVAPASPSSWCVYQFRHCRNSWAVSIPKVAESAR
jgi:hypothetical protein